MHEPNTRLSRVKQELNARLDEKLQKTYIYSKKSVTEEVNLMRA